MKEIKKHGNRRVVVACALMFVSAYHMVAYSENRYNNFATIPLDEMPGYFTPSTWKEIRIDTLSLTKLSNKITVVIDEPVYFVAGLKNKEVKLDFTSTKRTVEDPDHGTAVAGLIAANPSKLICKDGDKKKCHNKELVVAGVSRKTKLAYIPSPDDNDDLLEVIKRIFPDSLTTDDMKDMRTERDKPSIAIINMSFGSSVYDIVKADIVVNMLDEAHLASLSFDFHDYSFSRNGRLVPYRNLSDQLKNLLCQYIILGDYKSGIFGLEKQKVLENIGCKVDSPPFQKRKRSVKAALEKAARDEAEKKINFVQDDTIKDKDVLIVWSAGNDGIEAMPNSLGNGDNSSAILVVAAGCESAVNSKQYDELCDFSNHGKDYVDILAPGKDIPTILATSEKDNDVKATYMEGTSFATPIVAGVASLIAQCKPDMSAKEIKETILNKATHVNNGLTGKIKEGKVLNNDLESFLKELCRPSVAPNSLSPEEEKKQDL